MNRAISFTDTLYVNLPLDEASLLQHQILMGDVRILPEDKAVICQELNMGASLQSIKDKGLIK